MDFLQKPPSPPTQPFSVLQKKNHIVTIRFHDLVLYDVVQITVVDIPAERDGRMQ